MADYPGSITNLVNPASTDKTTSPSHSDQHSKANDEIEAIETELGVNPSGASATVVARLDANDTAVGLNTTHRTSSGVDHSYVLGLTNGSSNPTNLLSNGDFEVWSNGTSSDPDGWIGVAGTTAQEGTIIKSGTYSYKLTNVAASEGSKYQTIHSTRGISYWKGRTVTFGCWVYSATAGRVQIAINDGVTEEVSSFHTGNSTWQFLTATMTIGASATAVYAFTYIRTGGAISAYFDGAMMVEGSSSFAYSPKPVSWVDGTVNPTNLLSNGDFEAWSAGTAVAPDGWTLSAQLTAARSATVKIGTYSVQLTETSNNTQNLSQSIHTTKGIAYWKGRTVTFGCWIKSATVGQIFINIDDAIGSDSSSTNVGTDWEYKTVTRTISATATEVTCRLYLSNNGSVAFFDGAMLVEGSSAFAFSPKPSELCVAKDGTVNPTNLLSNGDFEAWSAGTAVAPDGWTATGVGIAVAREGTIKLKGDYSAKVTSPAGNGVYIQQYCTTAIGGAGYLPEKTVTASCWVWCDTADKAGLQLDDDGGDATLSSYHTGTSTWQLLTVTRVIPVTATVIRILLTVGAGTITAYFDGAMLVEGSSAFAFSPKPAEEGVWADYFASSTVEGWAAGKTGAIYTKKIGNAVFFIVIITGTSDQTYARFTMPYANATGITASGTMGYGQDAGTGLTVATQWEMGNTSSTINCYKDMNGGAWTNSGTKTVRLQGFYESA